MTFVAHSLLLSSTFHTENEDEVEEEGSSNDFVKKTAGYQI